MAIDRTLADIKKAEEYIEKKQKTIEKKRALIEKKRAKGDFDDADWLEEDIKRLHGEIVDKRRILQKHYEKLEAEKGKAAQIENMPEAFRRLYNDTVDTWDRYDIRCRERYRELREENEHVTKEKSEEVRRTQKWDEYFQWEGAYQKEFYEKSAPYRPYSGMSDEEIHKVNLKNGQDLIFNLYDRVVLITGEITDGMGLRVDRNNQGYSIINGVVHGNKGSATIESIGAGGYNIQRWHIRVLVHPLKDDHPLRKGHLAKSDPGDEPKVSTEEKKRVIREIHSQKKTVKVGDNLLGRVTEVYREAYSQWNPLGCSLDALCSEVRDLFNNDPVIMCKQLANLRYRMDQGEVKGLPFSSFKVRKLMMEVGTL